MPDTSLQSAVRQIVQAFGLESPLLQVRLGMWGDRLLEDVGIRLPRDSGSRVWSTRVEARSRCS